MVQLRQELTAIDHNGEVTELKIDGYPLGVREDTTYDTIEAQLSEGDYLVMSSDGIPETVNVEEEMFGLRADHRDCQGGVCRRNWCGGTGGSADEQGKGVRRGGTAGR